MAGCPPSLAADPAALAALGARVLSHLDEDYPPALRHLPQPPPVRSYKGALPRGLVSGAGPAVAIVGSRNPSSYGREAAWLFGRDLARAGVTIASGFARGIGGAAARGPLAGA